MLESLGSARIEGNHTTLADYVESRVEGRADATDQLREIANLERAMAYVEDVIKEGADITGHFIRELHALTVVDLDREGDKTPGAYRAGSVRIANSQHLPPDAVLVPQYMDELVAFINQADPQKYDLMKVALSHHRFGWIHPFGNGNGRVVRLLTYALLIKYGFDVTMGGRLLNPTAVFCNDRGRYYDMLGVADRGTEEGLEEWCQYVLAGVLDELKKIEKLTDYSYLKRHVLNPALAFAKERKLIDDTEAKILDVAITEGTIRAGVLVNILPGLNGNQRTYLIKKLLDRKMLQPVRDGAREYAPSFANNYLLRGIVHALRVESFIPDSMDYV